MGTIFVLARIEGSSYSGSDWPMNQSEGVLVWAISPSHISKTPPSKTPHPPPTAHLTLPPPMVTPPRISFLRPLPAAVRKKGVSWTEDEHKMFLLGLQKLGKGDWRGIARDYVVSRMPTQVASHAHKYFIRQSNLSRRQRRSSLFNIVSKESGDTPMESNEIISGHPDTLNNNPLPHAPVIDEECESMASTNSNEAESNIPTSDPTQSICSNDAPLSGQPSDSTQIHYRIVYPAFASAFYPFPVPFWTGQVLKSAKDTQEVVKPTAIHSKSPINVDELVGM